MLWKEFDTMVDNGLATTAMEYMLNSQVNFEQQPSDYPQEIRDNAASELVTALLASCDNQEQRIELSVSLLGYDPR
jgi:xanthine dehydrogenase molybdopterin-binding subunit B